MWRHRGTSVAACSQASAAAKTPPRLLYWREIEMAAAAYLISGGYGGGWHQAAWRLLRKRRQHDDEGWHRSHLSTIVTVTISRRRQPTSYNQPSMATVTSWRHRLAA